MAPLKIMHVNPNLRELWLKKGNKNTKFFHKMVNENKRRNFLAQIKIKGIWLTKQNEIKEVVDWAF